MKGGLSVQKVINNPQKVVDEMLEGYLKAYSEIIERTGNPRVIKYNRAPIDGRVGIVTGGGSGIHRLHRKEHGRCGCRR